MNDFLFMLTATLKLAPNTSHNIQDSDIDPNELTNHSNDSDKTVVFNGYSHSSSQEQSNKYQRPKRTELFQFEFGSVRLNF